MGIPRLTENEEDIGSSPGAQTPHALLDAGTAPIAIQSPRRSAGTSHTIIGLGLAS
jgi:hypothetical protein